MNIWAFRAHAMSISISINRRKILVSKNGAQLRNSVTICYGTGRERGGGSVSGKECHPEKSINWKYHREIFGLFKSIDVYEGRKHSIWFDYERLYNSSKTVIKDTNAQRKETFPAKVMGKKLNRTACEQKMNKLKKNMWVRTTTTTTTMAMCLLAHFE